MLGASLPASGSSTCFIVKVIHTITRIARADGGPALSVPSLANAQKTAGHDVQICTTGATAENKPVAHDVAEIHRLHRSSPLSIGRSKEMSRWVSQIDADVIHHHALWHRTLHYAHHKCRDSNLRFVVSPRGMMMPWAWNHHKLRKSIARKFIHPGAFERVNGWHATSGEEADIIRDLGFKQPICVAPNGVKIPSEAQDEIAIEYWHKTVPQTKTHRVALFYSRFHSKKRLIECIDSWAKTSAREWILLVVGIPDQFSVSEIEHYILKIGAQTRIRVYDGTHRPPPYAVSELFLLPSHSENFGMVVAEALANRVPAIVTEGSPWESLNSQASGWHVPWLNFQCTLDRALSLSSADLRLMGENARAWMRRDFSWTKSAQTLLDFYSTITPGHNP